MAANLEASRVLHKPRHLDPRALVGMCLFLAAVGGSLAFWSTISTGRDVLVVARNLDAGAVLRPTDLAIARVRVDDAVYQTTVPSAAQAQVVGRPLAVPVAGHQLLTWGDLSSRPHLAPGDVAMTIPVDVTTASGGRIQAGDEVEIFATGDAGTPQSRTTVVLPRARVYDVGGTQRTGAIATDGSMTTAAGSASPSMSLSWITLAVTEQQATALAQGRWGGKLDVALLPPSEAR